MDQNLTWEAHIGKLSMKLSSDCFLIRKIKNTVSLHISRCITGSVGTAVCAVNLGIVSASRESIQKTKQNYPLPYWSNS